MLSPAYEEKIAQYGRGYDDLAAALSNIPREAWDFRPGGTEWSVREVLLHMADSETIGITRLWKLIAEPGSTLMPYDGEGWAKGLDYSEQDADEALELFKLIRRRASRALASLTQGQAAHTVIHPMMEAPYGLDTWLGIYSEHVPEHVEQIRAIHAAWKEKT